MIEQAIAYVVEGWRIWLQLGVSGAVAFGLILAALFALARFLAWLGDRVDAQARRKSGGMDME